MNFDLTMVPFSRFGSYYAVSYLNERQTSQAGLYLRSVRGGGGLGGISMERGSLFRIELVNDGEPVPFEANASPAALQLSTDGGHATLCIAEPDVVRIRAEGVTVRLTSSEGGLYENAIPRMGGSWRVTHFSVNMNSILSSLKGSMLVDAPWRIDRSERIVFDLTPDAQDHVGEWAIEEDLTSWTPRAHDMDFDSCVRAVEAHYQNWLAAMPEVPAAYAEAAEAAAYVMWSCVVEPEGHLTRPGMFMSKNWMIGVWSWDHCFNAMALIYKYPELAWDQFVVPFDEQHESGALPDALNDKFMVWTYCKPPVHGWTLKKLMERSDYVDADRLAEIYEPLCKWTEWWFTYRDDDGDGIPQYHHGNDSGWDNSTVFAAMPPIESPDLSAFLVIQMDVLAEVAEILGKPGEAEAWKSRADDLLEKLLAHSWRGDRFVAPQSGTHETFDSQSLLLYVPLILGERLPEDVRAPLVAALKDGSRFLTPHGLATEMPSSPAYEPDGYWRGPIWAPSTMILIDGLDAAGESAFARELSRRFCDMAARSGMAENYDALTGEGLRDRAYTWTASVFLIFAHEYLS